MESDETRQAAIYLFVLYRTKSFFLIAQEKVFTREATGSEGKMFDILTNNSLRQVELLFLAATGGAKNARGDSAPTLAFVEII